MIKTFIIIFTDTGLILLITNINFNGGKKNVNNI